MMSNELDNADLDNWLEKVSAYDSGKELEGNIGELKTFLTRLQDNLTHSKTKLKLTDILKKFPKVGLLLGRLCDSERIILDGDAYQLLMQCVLLLYTSHPSHVIEQKATSWARTQIRKTVSYYKQEDPCSNLAQSIGCYPDRYNAESCQKLIEKITEGLQLSNASWEIKHGFMLPCRQLLSETLRQLSLQCIPLFEVPGANHLIEVLVSCHGCTSIREPLHQAFLDAVVKSQQNAYSDMPCDVNLSFQCHTALWKRYLPALEEEVIIMVRALLNHQHWLPREDVVKLINSRHLPLACLMDTAIYRVVAGILQAFIENTQANSDILNIVECFHLALRCSANDMSQLKTLPAICSLYPLCYRGMVNLLILSPHALSVESGCLHLTHLDKILTEVLNSTAICTTQDMYRLWLVLVSWQTWYYKAIEMLLKGKWSSLPPGMMLMCLFNYPLHPEKRDILKETLTSLADIFRQHINQSNSDFRDLNHAVSLLVKRTPLSSQATNVLHAMCQVYVVNFQTGLQDVHDVLAMVLPSDTVTNPICQLRFLLDAIEVHRTLNGTITSQTESTTDLMVKLLKDVKERCKRVIASENWDNPSSVDQISQRCGYAEDYLQKT